MKSLGVVGTGLVALDAVYPQDRESWSAAGGSCGNVLALLAWLGWKAWPIARIGKDPAGDFLHAELRNLGVHTDYLFREENVGTPVIVHRIRKDKVGQAIHRFQFVCPECGGWLPRYRPVTLRQADEIDLGRRSADVFYLDRTSPAAVRLAQEAKNAGSLVVFEPSASGSDDHLRSIIEICDVLKYSNERLRSLPDLHEAREPRLIVETCGGSGLRFRWRGRWTDLAAFSVNSIEDTAGAGDWCTAGLLHSLVGKERAVTRWRKELIVKALQHGQALATINCLFSGARGAMHLGKKELMKAVKKLPAPNSAPIDLLPNMGDRSSVDLCTICGPTATTKHELAM